MTPEEFTARATVAVEPLQPGPAAYTWLRTSIDRRRRRTRALAVAGVTASLALAGVAYATLPGDGTAPPVAGPSGAPSRVAAHFDFDGDGRMDDAFVVDELDRSWGVEVLRSTAGKATVAMPDGTLGRNEHAIAGSTDIDRDGRAEVLVSIGELHGERKYVLLVPVGEELVWLTDAGGDIVLLNESAEPGEVVALHCTDPSVGPGVVLDYRPTDRDHKVLEVRDGVLLPQGTRSEAAGPPLRPCLLG